MTQPSTYPTDTSLLGTLFAMDEDIHEGSSINSHTPTPAEQYPDDAIGGMVSNIFKLKKEGETSAIVFDWDDTLIPSSFLSEQKCAIDEANQNHIPFKEILEEFQGVLLRALDIALASTDKVFIITNAEHGWVELSAKKFFPAILDRLAKINIISARSRYETVYLNEPLKWKYFTMCEELRDVASWPDVAKNIMSFGDSNIERMAFQQLAKSIPRALCKSIKFAEHPTVEQLKRQLELVGNCFEYIFKFQGDLDLQLTVTVNQPPIQPPQTVSTAPSAPSSAITAPNDSPPVPPSIPPNVPSSQTTGRFQVTDSDYSFYYPETINPPNIYFPKPRRFSDLYGRNYLPEL